jgi:Papain fold toxin 1, glutamine deamidase
MVATDRPGSAQDAASDTARPDRDETGQERGPVLPGARVRQEQALAYRAEPVSIADIGHRLEKLGPGSSAIIGCGWSPSRIGGHWFNAVNDSGAIKAVDGQTARIELWPPSASVLGFDETMMKLSDAIFFTPDGKVARNDHT